MATTIIAASVATIPFGLINIEGLMLESGDFATTVQQAALLLSVRQDNAQRDFKALLGEGFQFVKVSTNRDEKQARRENAIFLTDFEILIAKLDRKGNKAAQDLRDELVGVSLTVGCTRNATTGF